jgi:hypothetical protein
MLPRPLACSCGASSSQFTADDLAGLASARQVVPMSERNPTFCNPAGGERGGLNVAGLLSVPEHRSGWGYVSRCLREVHDPDGPILVDFVEKVWLWTRDEEPVKWVHFQGESHAIARSEPLVPGKRNGSPIPAEPVNGSPGTGRAGPGP